MTSVTERPTVYVICGANGAGKTTFATKFLPDFVGCREFVNADMIAAGLSPFDPERQAATAGRLMIRRIDELTGQKVSFAFETTLSGRAHARRLAAMRAESGYRVVLFFLWLKCEAMAISRVAARVREGGHDIPTEIVKRRFRQGISNFANLYRNLADEWYIMDATEDAVHIVCQGTPTSVAVIDSPSTEQIKSLTPGLLR